MFRRDAGRKKPDRRVEDVPMTPMIDVFFQLLVFFVFTFEIPDRLSHMEVHRPRGGGPGPGAMRVGVYEEGFTLNDSRVSGETLQRTFNRLADLDPTQNVIVIATGQSKHSQLVHVLDLLNQAGLESVSLLSSN
jgi:biopolymer transport protein ExbD